MPNKSEHVTKPHLAPPHHLDQMRRGCSANPDLQKSLAVIWRLGVMQAHHTVQRAPLGAEVGECMGWPEMCCDLVCEHAHNFFMTQWLERSRVAAVCDQHLVEQAMCHPEHNLVANKNSPGHTRKLCCKPLAAAVSGASKNTALIPVRYVYARA